VRRIVDKRQRAVGAGGDERYRHVLHHRFEVAGLNVSLSAGVPETLDDPVECLLQFGVHVFLDELAALDPELPRQMKDIRPGSRQLLQSRLRGVPAELRVSVSEIRLDSGVERLYSIENLSGELTARESSAWRNLIRVLTHEIMNTLTPVTSLAQTTSGMLDSSAANDDIREAVQTIARRSEGLMNFVMRYRELLRLPQPDITRIVVSEALQGVVTLLGAELKDVEVSADVVPESLEVSADRALLDQVLVNVVKNALDAVRESGHGRIALRGRQQLGRTVISVCDNGTGIDAETLTQVFVPFFTTKREGSGIGLSLCRQIMTAHGGEIAIVSDGDGTTVSLIF
jgi:nitrogen fixation/metabolism regulation signal transduction histidine kinase